MTDEHIIGSFFEPDDAGDRGRIFLNALENNWIDILARRDMHPRDPSGQPNSLSDELYFYLIDLSKYNAEYVFGGYNEMYSNRIFKQYFSINRETKKLDPSKLIDFLNGTTVETTADRSSGKGKTTLGEIYLSNFKTPKDQSRLLQDGNTFVLDIKKLKELILKGETKINEHVDPIDFAGSSLLYDFVSLGIVEYDQKSGQFINNMTQTPYHEDKCFGSHFGCDGYGNQETCNQKKCDELFTKLLTNDFEGFAKFATDHENDFNMIVNDEIKTFDSLHPNVATMILDKFEFRINIDSGLRKYETYSDWENRMLEMNISEETKNSIRTSKPLRYYLDRVVRFVNDNPKILNHSKQEPIKNKSIDCISHYPDIPLLNIYNPDDGRDTLIEIAEMNKQHQILMRQRPPLFMGNHLHMPMSGGGEQYDTSRMKLLFKGLMSDLERKGKPLNEHDRRMIFSLIRSLEIVGDVLMKTTEKMTEFNRWLDINPSVIQDKTVSVGSIEDSIEKYRNIAQKYETIENGLLDIGGKISKM